MSYFGRLRAEVKSLRALFDFAILGGHSFVLAQMVGPRFSHKSLDVPLGVRSVTQEVPADRAVTLSNPLHLFHGLEEFFGGFWIDSIFNQRNSGALRRLKIDHHYRFRPNQRRR